ncbi:hypothetical protein WICPIJ_007110 [Wickerhamomyces pijperi]|uniref:Uncharacterized protein n=1 Tax=Wickerhamomyces pijperi TaxID=599730 RepID=A0A9P8Q359_WICPI|nr:hypothetical protein WICPIJ_007110 [Wickerhamomyces pijperi]
MDHWELEVLDLLDLLFVVSENTIVFIQEFQSGVWQVHDEMGYLLWNDDFVFGDLIFLFASSLSGLILDGAVLLLNVVQQSLVGLSNDDSTILVNALDEVTNLILGDILRHVLVTFRVQIVSKDNDSLLTSWDGKGTNTGHDIDDEITFVEGLNQTFVFRVQS